MFLPTFKRIKRNLKVKVKSSFVRILILLPAIALSACTGIVPYQIDLLPTPDVYAKKLVNPFPAEDVTKASPYRGILYVTDRLPSTKKHDEIYITYYTHNKRAGAFYRNFGFEQAPKLNDNQLVYRY